MKATTKKPALRQLRLITTVNATEKKQAERLAKAEGYASVAEFVRHLLRERHMARRANAKKNSAKSATDARKPARSVAARKRSTSRSTSRPSKDASNRGVVSAGNKSGRSSRGRTKSRAALN